MPAKKSAAERAIESTALRLCREAYRLNATRILWWNSARQIQQELGIDDAAALAGWRYARARHWIDTSRGDEIGMIALFEAGRELFFEEESYPPV
jgi:hypothetical protein